MTIIRIVKVCSFAATMFLGFVCAAWGETPVGTLELRTADHFDVSARLDVLQGMATQPDVDNPVGDQNNDDEDEPLDPVPADSGNVPDSVLQTGPIGDVR
ncbi:MAG TPA: hypothetical protein VET48_13615, partial [Steroidobacteraceae bacterium]|nr:hypothetical protein [Steroidobacteraceae bacterium]